jgi:hypothetical protein
VLLLHLHVPAGLADSLLRRLERGGGESLDLESAGGVGGGVLVHGEEYIELLGGGVLTVLEVCLSLVKPGERRFSTLDVLEGTEELVVGYWGRDVVGQGRRRGGLQRCVGGKNRKCSKTGGRGGNEGCHAGHDWK